MAVMTPMILMTIMAMITVISVMTASFNDFLNSLDLSLWDGILV